MEGEGEDGKGGWKGEEGQMKKGGGRWEGMEGRARGEWNSTSGHMQRDA